MPLDPGTFYKLTFCAAAEAVGLGPSEEDGLPGVRFHDLRHTAPSLWLAQGESMMCVSRWLGHSSIEITDRIYAHLYPTDEELHRERVERRRVLTARSRHSSPSSSGLGGTPR